MVDTRPFITDKGQSPPWYFTLLLNSRVQGENNVFYQDVNYIAFLHWFRFRYFFNPMQWNHLCMRYIK